MKQYIAVDFLDKPRRMRFTVNSICDLEKNLGMPIGKAFSEDSIGLETIRALLWAGLKWEDRLLSATMTGDLIQKYLEDGGAMAEITRVIGESLSASGIIKQAKPGEPEADPTPGTPVPSTT